MTYFSVQLNSHLSWVFFAVLESAKLVSVLMTILISRDTQNGLQSTQLQLHMGKALLSMAITLQAALRKQHLLALTAEEQLSHPMVPSKV